MKLRDRAAGAAGGRGRRPGDPGYLPGAATRQFDSFARSSLSSSSLMARPMRSMV